MKYDFDKKAFVDAEREVPMKVGIVADDLAYLVASVAMNPNTAQSVYIEILKMMASGQVTTKNHDAYIQSQNDAAFKRAILASKGRITG